MSTAGPDAEHLLIRGLRLAVTQSGHGARQLLLVHGFQHDHTVWDPLIRRLDSQRYRFTAFDLAGCGASENPDNPQRCSIGEYAEDLAALCDALALHRPVLVGHSLGAGIAISAALAAPDRYAGLVLVAPTSTTGMDFLPDEASFTALAHPTFDQQLALARRAFRHPRPDAELAELESVIRNATAEHIAGAAYSMRDFNIQGRLGGLKTPTMLVCGDRDRHMPLRNHLATWAAIPRCGLQVYFDVAHVPFVETPQRCAEDVQRFLATLG